MAVGIVDIVENFTFNGYTCPVISSSVINSIQDYNSIGFTQDNSQLGPTVIQKFLTKTTAPILSQAISEAREIPIETPIGTTIINETFHAPIGSIDLNCTHIVSCYSYDSQNKSLRGYYQYKNSDNEDFLIISYGRLYNKNTNLFNRDSYNLKYGSGNVGNVLIKFIDNGVSYYAPVDLTVTLRTDTDYTTIFSYKRSSNIFGFSNPITESELKNIGTILPPYKPLPDNPYEPIDPSQPGGGGGAFDDTSDNIPDSVSPTLSSSNTGFTRIYNPTLGQVQALAAYLWTDQTVIDTIWNHIKQYFEDPMQAIIGFNLVPVPVPDGGVEEFKLMFIGTGVQMTVAANQFVDVDCGTYTLEKYYGSALDYAPYTKISCFLPFIGNVELNPDEVMGTTLQVVYRVDICSGSCVAKILVDGNCIYQYSGHCAIPIPLASADFSSYVSAAISVAKLAIGVATAGAAAGLAAAGAVAGAEAAQATGQVVETTQIVNTARNEATGRQITTGTQTITTSRPSPQAQTKASFSGLSPSNITNTVGEVMSSKPTFQHSGSFSGNTGYLGVRRPYLIITRPNLCMPESYQKLNGYPCMMTLTLGDCTGYTKVQQVQLTGLWATNPEQDEILQLLKSGVIL